MMKGIGLTKTEIGTKLPSIIIDVIDAEASSEVHGVGAYAPWSRTCVASSPQLNFSPAFPGKNQRHLWFFENAYDDLRAVLHVES